MLLLMLAGILAGLSRDSPNICTLQWHHSLHPGLPVDLGGHPSPELWCLQHASSPQVLVPPLE